MLLLKKDKKTLCALSLSPFLLRLSFYVYYPQEQSLSVCYPGAQGCVLGTPNVLLWVSHTGKETEIYVMKTVLTCFQPHKLYFILEILINVILYERHQDCISIDRFKIKCITKNACTFKLFLNIHIAFSTSSCLEQLIVALNNLQLP